MALTEARFSAAQYALLSALAAVGRVYVGPASGVMVEGFGWPLFFMLTVVAALPASVLLWWLRADVRVFGIGQTLGRGRRLVSAPGASPECEP
jgi:PAT family beta-lactamase induction signal transducer AmpG